MTTTTKNPLNDKKNLDLVVGLARNYLTALFADGRRLSSPQLVACTVGIPSEIECVLGDPLMAWASSPFAVALGEMIKDNTIRFVKDGDIAFYEKTTVGAGSEAN